MTNNKSSRQLLREQFRTLRKSLDISQQNSAAIKISEKISNNIDMSHIRKVAVYLANDGEIDLSILVRELWQQGKSTYLPVVDQDCPGKLLFARYTANTSMIQNKYGILEPDITNTEMCPVECLDIVFTPLVAFDCQGNRLGMGGGYYDRTLASLEFTQHRVLLVGLAHACQQAESLQQQSWDIPMDKIITDQHVIVSRH